MRKIWVTLNEDDLACCVHENSPNQKTSGRGVLYYEQGVELGHRSVNVLLGRDLEPGECVGPLWVRSEIEQRALADEILETTIEFSRDNDGWTPVEEGLPDEGRPVQVTCWDGEPYIPDCPAKIVDGEWLCCDGTDSEPGFKIIAWRPRPKPYQPKVSEPCEVCMGLGENKDELQAWDIPGAPIPPCTACGGTGVKAYQPEGGEDGQGHQEKS